MANVAAVMKRAPRGRRAAVAPAVSHDDDAFALEELYADALLGAKSGDMSAAETFADQLMSIFNATPTSALGGKSPDEAFERLAAALGLGGDEALRGAL